MTTTEHNTIECAFTHAKETKGTHQYKEDGEPSAHKVGTIYLKKAVTGTNAPDHIKVTVEW
jgi:hypothetical protein